MSGHVVLLKYNTSDQSEYLYMLVATLNIGNVWTCCITKVQHVGSVRVLVYASFNIQYRKRLDVLYY